MGKSKSTRQGSHLPLPPCLYVNDPSYPSYSRALKAMLPKVQSSYVSKAITQAEIATALDATKASLSVALFVETATEASTRPESRRCSLIRDTCIKHGRNFASVEFRKTATDADVKATEPPPLAKHLSLDVAALTPEQAAAEVVKWLCKIFRLSCLAFQSRIPDLLT